MFVSHWQESEEVRSNCLDKKLRLRESELTVHMRERSQMEEVMELICSVKHLL